MATSPKNRIVNKAFNFDNLNISIPKRKSNSHKGLNGRVLVIAGSRGLGGQRKGNQKKTTGKLYREKNKKTIKTN